MNLFDYSGDSLYQLFFDSEQKAERAVASSSTSPESGPVMTGAGVVRPRAGGLLGSYQQRVVNRIREITHDELSPQGCLTILHMMYTGFSLALVYIMGSKSLAYIYTFTLGLNMIYQGLEHFFLTTTNHKFNKNQPIPSFILVLATYGGIGICVGMLHLFELTHVLIPGSMLTILAMLTIPFKMMEAFLNLLQKVNSRTGVR